MDNEDCSKSWAYPWTINAPVQIIKQTATEDQGVS